MNFYDVNAAAERPNFVNAFREGQQYGTHLRQQQRAEGDYNALRTLVPQIIAGDQNAYGQAMAIDPDRANVAQAAGDNQVLRLQGAVAYMDKMEASGNPAAAENAWRQQIRPYLAKHGNGQQPPESWAEAKPLMEAARGRIAMLGQQPTQGLTPSMQSVEDAYRRGLITREEYDKAVRVALNLAPGASAPALSYVERWNPTTQQMERVPMQTRGIDYTNDAPSLAGGGNAWAGAGSAPGGNAPPNHLVVADGTGQPDQEFANLPDAVRMRAAELEAQGAPFHIANGRLVEGFSPGAQGGPPPSQPAAGGYPPNARPQSPPAPSPSFGGGFPSGPSGAERIRQQELEAAAGARGRIAGERESGPNFDDEAALRREYDTAIKEPREIINAYGRVEGAAQNPTAAGDLSLIFAYMKMLDPGSVVREGEFANAQNAAGIPDRIWNLYNRAMAGERLNPAQRADFLQQASKLRDQAQARLDTANERYRGLAPQYYMDPDRIAPPPAAAAPGPGATGGSYTMGQVLEIGGKRYRVVGGDPNDPDVEEVR